MTNRLTRFDNGNTTEEHFDGVTGALDVVIEQDLADEESWVQILTSYDNLGTAIQSTSFNNGVTREDRIQPALIQFKVTVYDNGSIDRTYFENDEQIVADRIDHEDVFVWDVKVTQYDEDENVSSRFTEFDNGDELVFIYVEQELQARISIDGDNSHAWEAKLTVYQPGEAVVTTYDSLDELPDLYADISGYGTFII
ncbi:MAG: hypothetical protein ABJN14_09095 [Paracoccaceae bacterium]